MCSLYNPQQPDKAGVENNKLSACGVPYAVGDLILCGADGLVICGPVNRGRAVDLAVRVLEGEQRAVLDSRTAYVLAIGLLLGAPSHTAPSDGE